MFFILHCGLFFNVQAQTGSKNWNTTIGKIFKKISEIDVFKNYKVDESVLIVESKEQKNVFIKISDGDRTLVLWAKYPPQGY